MFSYKKMELTFFSRKLKKQITFLRPEGSCYVYADLGIGRLRQFCEGGGFLGSTQTFHGDDLDAFKRHYRSEWRRHMRGIRRREIADAFADSFYN